MSMLLSHHEPARIVPSSVWRCRMNPTITAFAQSPDRGRGLARDMAVRWALEEVGQPYDVRLLSFAAMKEAGHRALQPFGQIPTYEDGTIALFESAAIVLHVAERHTGLLPDNSDARARAIAWMFAAKSTVEPPVVERSMAVMFEADRPWHAERLPLLDERVRGRLGDLSRWLADRDWLEEEFGAADVVMVTVLRRLGGSGLLEEHQTVAAYVARGEARPAFGRAFEAQRAVFTAATA
jgi:glutathione S-transferase